MTKQYEEMNGKERRLDKVVKQKREVNTTVEEYGKDIGTGAL